MPENATLHYKWFITTEINQDSHIPTTQYFSVTKNINRKLLNWDMNI